MCIHRGSGIAVESIALSQKAVTLKGFNGLKDAVKIETFDLPSNHPDGGIRLTLESSVTNVSYAHLVIFTTSLSGLDLALASGYACQLSRLQHIGRRSHDCCCHR